MESTKDFASQNGYVETLFGRRLYLRDINASNAIRRQASERAAINAPVQGTAADIMKIAMIKTHQAIKAENVKAKLILQVHDELIFEIDEANKEVSIEQIKSVMENIHLNFKNFEVPLLVDYGFGENWGDAH